MTIRNRVNPGKSSIPADEYSALLALLRKDLRADFSASSVGKDFDNTKVWVRNDSGHDRDRFEILGIKDSLVIDPAQSGQVGANYDHVVLVGEHPDSDAHSEKFVVCQEPIPAGKIGRAVISGVTWAKLSIASTSHVTGHVTSNQGYLTTDGGGAAQIVWKESGTGAGKIGIVRIGPRCEHIYNATLETAAFSATASEVQKNFTSVNESNYYGSGHLTLSAGIVTSANTAIYDWIFTITGYMGYVRNDYGRIMVYFQYRQSSSASWGGGTLLQHTIAWPDIAVIAAPGELNYFKHTAAGVGLVMYAGAQVRITAQVEYATTAPYISVGANVNLRETRKWLTAGEVI